MSQPLLKKSAINPDSALDFVMRENLISSLATRQGGRKNENQSKYEVRFFRHKFLMRIPGFIRFIPKAFGIYPENFWDLSRKLLGFNAEDGLLLANKKQV
jgi:hypothetical protein